MITVLSAGKEFKLPERFSKMLTPVLDTASETGAKLYIFGGFLRDLLEGKMPSDGDIYVENFPSTKFTHELMERKVIQRKKDYTGPIPMKEDILLMLSETTMRGFEFDFVSSGAPSIQEYLKRSDFTINTLYYDLQANKLFDPTGRGVKDIKSKILFPNSKNLTAIEVLRAVKLVMLYGYQLTPQTMMQIKQAAPGLADVGMGMASKILNKLYSTNPTRADELMNQLGITQYIPDYILESVKSEEA